MNTYLDLFLNEYESAGTRKNYGSTITAMLNYIGKDIHNIENLAVLSSANDEVARLFASSSKYTNPQ